MASGVPLASLTASPLMLAGSNGTVTLGASRQVLIYQRGTTTTIPVYSNQGLTTSLSQPLTTGTDGTIPGYIAAEQQIDIFDVASGKRTQGEPLSVADLIGSDGKIGGTGSLGLASSAAGVAAAAVGVDITTFGAVCDSGVTDNTAAIMAAYHSLPSVTVSGATVYVGGTLIFPPGPATAYPGPYYGCAGQLDFSNSVGLTLKGFGHPTSAGASAAPTSSVRYTGAATANPFIKICSTTGFRCQDLDVGFVAPATGSFTGALFDAQHSSVGNDTAYAKWERCRISGPSGVTTCRTLISLEDAIFCTCEDVSFDCAQHSVRLIDTSGGYSNGHTFVRCYHNSGIAGPAFMNAAQNTNIIANGFEGCLVYGYDLAAGTNCISLNFIGGWVGDATPAGNVWDFTNQYPIDLNIEGYAVLGGAKGVVFGKGGRGIRIKSEFETSVGIDLGDVNGAGAGICDGVDLAGCQFLDVPTPVANRQIHRSVVQIGTGPVSSTNYPDDLLSVFGHITTDRLSAGAPTVAANANAGTGATVSIQGNDITGRVTITTGTAPAVGVLASVTFGLAYEATYESYGNGSSWANPKVQITANNHAAANCGATFNDATTTGFDIGVQTVPAASTALVFDYFVIQ